MSIMLKHSIQEATSGSKMKLIDMHSHWGTKRGYVLRTAAELAQQKKTWNSETTYVTEE